MPVHIYDQPMLTCSFGWRTCVSFFLSVNDMAKDRLPTRPRYMSRMSVALPQVVSVAVIPVLIPTVLIADTTSKTMAVSSSGCTVQTTKTAMTDNSRFVVKTAAAFETASSSRRRPRILTPSERVRFALRWSRSTARVVTLIPPAVEPGHPPINIRMMVRSWLLSVSLPTSIVLKPAVLGVTAQNRAFKTASEVLISANRWFLSNSKNKTVPPSVKMRETISTIFV